MNKRCKFCGRWKGKKHKCPDENPMKGVNRFGKDAPNWAGGRIIIKGYIWIFSPEHPYRNSSNYVAEHRLIIENNIGRFLMPFEVVHHKNGMRNDNRIENLQLLKDLGEHNRLHKIHLSSPRTKFRKTK